ncbi:MAG: helix-turn-helix transcriptional regulator [Xanthomonadales bacterium]|nr:helix-turn-helix transcriptional regulator [Xanthomonadales bacterium]
MIPIKTRKDIGRLIRCARKERDWSQSDLAERLGCTQKTVSHIETGKSDPLLETVLRAMNMLRLDLVAYPRERNDRPALMRKPPLSRSPRNGDS